MFTVDNVLRPKQITAAGFGSFRVAGNYGQRRPSRGNTGSDRLLVQLQISHDRAGEHGQHDAVHRAAASRAEGVRVRERMLQAHPALARAQPPGAARGL